LAHDRLHPSEDVGGKREFGFGESIHFSTLIGAGDRVGPVKFPLGATGTLAGMTPHIEAGMRLIAKPRKTTLWCWITAAAALAGSVLVASAMGTMTEGGGVFHGADQFAMVGLGVVAAAAILMFSRPRVWAGPEGVKIRNVVGAYELPWQVVRSVSFPQGASWAQLELADDDVVSVMAIQAVDKEHAVAAVRQLRALLSESAG
jgi:hypothetical protein